MNKYELLSQFLDRWPLDRVQSMTLEEYTDTKRNDSFCYWLERRTDSLGGISGGSSFKFGIYKSATETSEAPSKKVSTDGEYVWLDKYGNSKGEAFEKVKSLIIVVIEASKAGRFSDIDSIDLGDATKWKIAFLYSDYKLFNTFNYDNLLSICDDLEIPTTPKEPISSLSQKIFSKKVSDEDYFEFGSQFWNQPLVSQNLKRTLLKNIHNVQIYFEVMDLIVSHFNLQKSDPRFYFNYDKGQLIFTIGQRYVWNLYNGMFRYISKERFESQYEEFISSQKIEAYSNQTLNVPTPESLFLRMRDAIEWELKRTEISGFKKYNKADFERLVFDKEYRQCIYRKLLILSKTKNSTFKPLGNTNKMSKSPLNQILYGPPGTGKTYNTINKAVAIANPLFDLQQDRAIVKAEYQRLVDTGQIVFTTFHQSMSYEDFVEGIKPLIDEDEDGNKQVVYEIQNGIFKDIVRDAIKTKNTDNTDRPYTFDDAWYELIQYSNREIENDKNLFLPIQTKNLGLNVIGISAKGNLVLKPIYSNNSKEYIVSYSRARKLHEVYHDLSIIKNIDKEFRAIIGGSNSTAYWSVLNFINNKISLKAKDNSSTGNVLEPHILIIDEINRGNVSAIFGELITLIEDSKREGKPEALEVILPYSKEKFSIPSNLYIIGTMNTADRSVEALDTALRRRFVFEEMMPKPELLGQDLYGFAGSAILERINQRIEKLIDRDHCIGHAYFIGKNEETIVESFYKNIIPLLQEYFFGDYGKIGLVLGQGFVRLKKEEGNVFADFDYNYVDDLASKPIYEIIDYRISTEEGLSFEKAIQDLMR